MVHNLSKDGDLDTYFEWMKEMIENQREKMKKVLGFFHSVARQSLVYEYLNDVLQTKGHIGYPLHNDTTH